MSALATTPAESNVANPLLRIADRLGRRYAMTVECGVFMIGVLIQITTFTSWVQFAIGRLVSGLGVGSLSAAVPMYQAETAPPQIRGTLTATYQCAALHSSP